MIGFDTPQIDFSSAQWTELPQLTKNAEKFMISLGKTFVDTGIGEIDTIKTKLNAMILQGTWPRVLPGYAALLWFAQKVISACSESPHCIIVRLCMLYWAIVDASTCVQTIPCSTTHRLPCTTICYHPLPYATTHYPIPPCTTVCYHPLPYATVHYPMLPHTTLCYWCMVACMVPYGSAWHVSIAIG